MKTAEPRAPVEQRIALGDALVRLGSEFPDLVVLSPDVSPSTRATKFRAAHPDRFICSGIAEQNTLGMAAGLATCGWRPVVAGYAMFVAGKAWEPLRNSVAYSGLDVKIVATHAGINVGPDGVTHQAIEDIALMRAVPGMVVLAPTDANQVEPALRAALGVDGPVYIRLERAAIPLLTAADAPFAIGDALTLRQGHDVAIIAIGSMVAAAMQSAETLAAEGIQARVISLVSLKPLTEAVVLAAARETGAIVTAEDHNRHGGLGSAVAEALVQAEPAPVEMVALADTFAESGAVDALRVRYHLTAADITAAARRAIARRDRAGWQRRPPDTSSDPLRGTAPTAPGAPGHLPAVGVDTAAAPTGIGPASKSAPGLGDLAERARRMRAHVIRMTCAAGSGHPGPAFSAIDILAALYFAEMRVDPGQPHALDRDRFVLSKGHGAPALYAALHEAGFFDTATMLSLRQIGSLLQGHPHVKTPGVDATTGSLGLGLSQAVGMAVGARMRELPCRVYSLVGDGECDEGQIWEAALAAAHYGLGNLAVFIDHNRYQFDGPVCDVMGLEPLADKWRAFGWRVEEINGHDFTDILAFLSRARATPDRPSLAVAHTVKGHGVSFMAGNQEYHARSLTADEAERALAELAAQAPA